MLLGKQRENTSKKIDEFLTTALKIDLRDMNAVDIHRLPQIPSIIKTEKVINL